MRIEKPSATLDIFSWAKPFIIALVVSLTGSPLIIAGTVRADATAEAEIAALSKMTDAELERRAKIEYMLSVTKDNNARLEHRIAMMQHDQSLFSWQRHASEILLWVVVAVVVCGLSFAGYQLVVVMELARRQSLQTIKQSESARQESGHQSTTTQMVLGLNKLEVTSSVVGITVLVISIAFLYLFVREVYTIHQPNNEEAATKVESPTAE